MRPSIPSQYTLLAPKTTGKLQKRGNLQSKTSLLHRPVGRITRGHKTSKLVLMAIAAIYISGITEVGHLLGAMKESSGQISSTKNHGTSTSQTLLHLLFVATPRALVGKALQWALQLGFSIAWGMVMPSSLCGMLQHREFSRFQSVSRRTTGQLSSTDTDFPRTAFSTRNHEIQ